MDLLLVIVFFILILILTSFRNEIKGRFGEKEISAILYFLNGAKFKVLNNIVLSDGGHTAQIDHVVISDFGIFVIETKNYKGWILGGEDSEYWTQVIYKHKKQFYNPIRQNLGHIRALKKLLLEYPHLEYVSIIVFSSKANIKVKTNTEVIYAKHLRKTIKQYSDAKLTEVDKENIFKKISTSNSVDTYNKRQHIESIKKRILEKESLIEENRCPRCGCELTVRNGKFGRFMGCTTYPTCRYTQKI